MNNGKREVHTECRYCHTKVILTQIWGITDNQEGKQKQWNPGDEHLSCPYCKISGGSVAAQRSKHESTIT